MSMQRMNVEYANFCWFRQNWLPKQCPLSDHKVNVRLIISIRMSTYFDNSMITPDHSEIIGKGSVKKRSSISRTYSPPFRENHLVASTFFDLPTDLNSHSTSLDTGNSMWNSQYCFNKLFMCLCVLFTWFVSVHIHASWRGCQCSVACGPLL